MAPILYTGKTLAILTFRPDVIIYYLFNAANCLPDHFTCSNKHVCGNSSTKINSIFPKMAINPIIFCALPPVWPVV